MDDARTRADEIIARDAKAALRRAGWVNGATKRQNRILDFFFGKRDHPKGPAQQLRAHSLTERGLRDDIYSMLLTYDEVSFAVLIGKASVSAVLKDGRKVSIEFKWTDRDATKLP